MEALYPPSCISNSTWFSTRWTKEENKRFESALAIHDEDTPDRWFKIAAIVGKSVMDVEIKYRELEEDVCEIEAGRDPIHGYLCSTFALESMGGRDFDACRKKSSAGRGADHERKKGVPWTQEEHRRFLMGLLKYGKGDWRNISRKFVVTKTPTQVASHAQKYFMRQLSGVKDKRRPSIHDITTVNLTDPASSSENNRVPSLDESNVLSSQQKLISAPELALDHSLSHYGGFMFFDSSQGHLFMPDAYGFGLNGMRLQEKHNPDGVYPSTGFHTSLIGIHSSRHQIQG
ncbi:uncharacterized protein J3R85_009125 [Psidium guajava]|nr:uncharacterized protein J3R85_009125 [Psidium guajava]